MKNKRCKVEKYIIIPGSSDLNRGDQALAWETKEIANGAGFNGAFSLVAEQSEPVFQSEKEGYNILTPVLEHPSRFFQSKENINYNLWIKIKWGMVAVYDLLISLGLLTKFGRNFYRKVSKNNNKKNTLIEFEEAQAIFMKGGGLIQSHGGLLSTYATYYRVYHILFAQSLKKDVYIMPNSFGPFEGPFVKKIVKKAFHGCKFISVREEKSHQVVKKELKMNFPVYPDLAFYLKAEEITKRELFLKYDIPFDAITVAITMRPYRFPNAENPEKSYSKFKSEMASLIDALSIKGYLPVIIEHTHAITTHENDGETIQEVLKLVKNDTKYKFISNPNINCRQLKSVYKHCNYIIGTRFHSLIFSLSEYVPGIAISYDGYKSIGIMKDMELEEYVVDIGDVTKDKLEEMFKSVIENEEEIKERIRVYKIKAEKMKINLINSIKE